MPFPSVAPSLLIGADRPGSLIGREVFGQLQIPPDTVRSTTFPEKHIPSSRLMEEWSGLLTIGRYRYTAMQALDGRRE